MRVTVDDAAIDAIDDGDGDAIVFIHGFPFAREIWDAQAAQLARTHHVIRLDLRGAGRSSAPDGPYLMETLAGDVAAVLDNAGVQRATVVGHSLGGYVALAFARMYTERVERLSLVCSRLAADSAETAQSRNDLADRLELENSIDAAIEAYFPKLFAPRTYDERPKIVERAREIARHVSPRGAAAMLRGMAQRADSYDIAGELGMPVLIVAGAYDRVVSLQEANEMSACFPAATLVVMERSGHVPMLEEPDALSASLAAFTADSGRRGDGRDL